MALVKVNQDIKDMRGALKSCEDAQERRKLRKLITALLEKKAGLLDDEARLADMAACVSLERSNRAAGMVLQFCQQQTHAGLACSGAAPGDRAWFGSAAGSGRLLSQLVLTDDGASQQPRRRVLSAVSITLDTVSRCSVLTLWAW